MKRLEEEPESRFQPQIFVGVKVKTNIKKIRSNMRHMDSDKKQQFRKTQILDNKDDPFKPRTVYKYPWINLAKTTKKQNLNQKKTFNEGEKKNARQDTEGYTTKNQKQK